MRVEPVDERDSSWEDAAPRFRVYVFSAPADSQSWSTCTDDVTEADATEVIAWAHEQAGRVDGLYAVALVGEHDAAGRPGRGLTWLVGFDANDTRRSETEQRWFEAMLRRREQYRTAHRGE